jgi:phosphatidylglycerol---prolipoprotein diacylglyceryl transferase
LLALTLTFPTIDPVAVQLGPLAIRWYALAYIAGILLGWRYAAHLAGRPPLIMDRAAVDDFIVWVTVGIIFGGRLGYVLFYKPGYYLYNPIEIAYLWRGGMSFHGGMLGVIAAIVLFARRRRIPLLALGDIVCAVVPIGLFFGRIANFINAELYGRVSDVPWAMVFPHSDGQPRHPSQLYQATLEGVVLFAILAVLAHRTELRQRPGLISGAFLAGYAVARMIGELFREPDAHLGFILGPVTMGQLLSVPMLLAGLYLIVTSARRPKLPLAKSAA